MNSASQDFPKHLGVLRERMLHPTDYEKAVYYFLEEFLECFPSVTRESACRLLERSESALLAA